MDFECGVRVTKDMLNLTEEEYSKIVGNCTPVFKRLLLDQRHRIQLIETSTAQKSIDGSMLSKGLELYCRIKGSENVQSTSEEDLEKNIGRIIGALASRVECGVRVKEFVIGLSHEAFENYVDTAAVMFEQNMLSQWQRHNPKSRTKQVKSIFQEMEELDAKGIEFYCGTKSMCGG